MLASCPRYLPAGDTEDNTMCIHTRLYLAATLAAAIALGASLYSAVNHADASAFTPLPGPVAMGGLY